MATVNPKASVRAVVREITAGTLVAPGSGQDFIPIRPSKSMASSYEKLDNEELVNDIGASKPAIGKESVEGAHPAYLKASEVVGTAPDANLFYEGAFGATSIAAVEYPTVAASTTTLIKVDTGIGASFEVGEALMIKDSTNGFSMRNIKSISGDDLTLNFAVTTAPAVSINLGRSVLYKPAATGHPSLSVWDYEGNGGMVQASAGCRVSAMNLTLDANAQAEVEFEFQGSSYLVNPVQLTSSTRFLDWSDTSGTYAISLTAKFYKTVVELADAIAQAMNDSASTAVFTVVYVDSSGKFKFTATGVAAFSLLWNTGTNTANSMATKIGFTTGANSTGALTYTATNAISYIAPYTGTYDNASNITVKNGELFIGDQTDNVCVCAQKMSIKLSNTIADVDCICSESGVQEKQITKREVTLTATVAINAGEVAIFDKLIQNKTVSVMVNIGPKAGGNWVPLKCVNLYLGNATITSAPIAGDVIMTAELTIVGFVTTSLKDLYLNLI